VGEDNVRLDSVELCTEVLDMEEVDDSDEGDQREVV
jgi:hypothetical protein